MSKINRVLTRLKLNTYKNYAVYNGYKYTGSGREIPIVNPTNNELISSVVSGSYKDYEDCIQRTYESKNKLKEVPDPIKKTFVKKLVKNTIFYKNDINYLYLTEFGRDGDSEMNLFLKICVDNLEKLEEDKKGLTAIEGCNGYNGYPKYSTMGICTKSILSNNPFIVFSGPSLTILAIHKIFIMTLEDCFIDTDIATLIQKEHPILLRSSMKNDKKITSMYSQDFNFY
jgi:acyl-CoA reductase-like NAD-dependent aldehyde dehydrogenase